MQPYEKDHEKEAFKTLSFKDKIDHIWTYYKVPIILGAIGLFVLGWCLNHYIFNPPAVDDGVIILFNTYDEKEPIEEFREGINAHFADQLEENHEIDVSTLMNYGDSIIYYEQQIANTEKIVAMIAGNELDILVGNEAIINTFAFVQEEESQTELLYLSPLTDVFSEEELQYIQDAGFSVTDYSICVSGKNTNLYNAIEQYGEIPYMAFGITCDKEISRKMAYYIMNIPELETAQ